MDETSSLLNQVLAIRDDHTTDPDDRVWVALELLAQHLDGETDETPIARLTTDKPKPRRLEVTWGALASRATEDALQS